MKKLLGAASALLLLASCGQDLSQLNMLKNQTENTFEVKLNFTNVKSSEGDICVSIFSEGGDFPQEDGTPDFVECFSTEIGMESGVSVKLPEGVYAAAVFHDKNSNGTMDKNGLGIPKEAFGFSNNPKIKMSAPKFEDCAFTVNSETELSIKLRKLF